MEKKLFENPQKALLIIDILEDYTGENAKPPFPYKDSLKLIRSVNEIIKKAIEKNILVVYLRQEFEGLYGKLFSRIFSGGTAIKGSPGTAIDKRLKILSDHIFTKPEADSFANRQLEIFLDSHHVNELYLTGLDAEYCVYSTAKAALKRGYTVNIITDGVAIKKEKNRNRIIEKYKQAGANLITLEGF